MSLSKEKLFGNIEEIEEALARLDHDESLHDHSEFNYSNLLRLSKEDEELNYDSPPSNKKTIRD